MDDNPADTAKVRNDLGTGNRLAMVVQKAAERMKNSTTVERIIIGLLAAFVAMTSYVAIRVNDLHSDVSALSREVGVGIERVNSHLGNHPDGPINRRIDRHEEQMH